METHLETTKDDGLKPGTVRVGLPNEEKIDWALVGDNAVPNSPLQYWLRRTKLADVPLLRGREGVTKPMVDDGGVLIVVGDGNSGEEAG